MGRVEERGDMSRWRTSLRPVVAAVGALALLAGCSGGDVRDSAGKVVAPGSWSVFDLRPGDCLDPGDDLSGDISDIDVVPCDDPHTQEVFATVSHPEGPYPGAAAVATWADAACLTELEAELGLTMADGIFISYLLPSFDGWNKNQDRTVVCVMVFPDRGSVVGSYVEGTVTITTDSGSTEAGGGA